jgi:hypothetical protein
MLPPVMRSWHLKNFGSSNVTLLTFNERCGCD